MIKQLIDIDHTIYQIDYINSTSIGRKLNDAEKVDIINNVDNFIEDCIKMFPSLNDPLKFINKHHINYIEDTESLNTEHYVEFAYFLEPNTISINKHVFEAVFMDEMVSTFITLDDCVKMLLYHELFHYLESSYKASLDKLKKDKYKILHKRKYRTLTSELSAMKFTQILSKNEYSPYVLNVILLLSSNYELSKRIFDRVVLLNELYMED